MIPTMKNSISRRSFMQWSSLAAVGAASGAGSALMSGVPARAQALAALGKPSPIRFGLTSYTFRNFSRVQLIGFMQQLNVNSLSCDNAMDHLPTDPTLEVQALGDYASANITLHAAGAIAFPTNNESYIRDKFDYARRAGIDLIVADPAPVALPLLGQLAHEYAMRVAIRNRGPENRAFASPFDVLKAIKDLDTRIGCCIDVSQTVRANASVAEEIHLAGSRLYNVQVNDIPATIGNPAQVPVGSGIVPFREVFEALIAIGYPDFVDLAYDADPGDPMPGVTASYAYLRGVLNGMGYATRTER